jgi:hypothetical protein
MNRAWSTLTFGARPKRSDEHQERIGPLRGVAVLGLDALASAAHGRSCRTHWRSASCSSPGSRSSTLRGIRSTAVAFLLPAYLFIGRLGITLPVGVGRAVAGDVHVAAPAASAPGASTAMVTPWLIARAFANGSTAMTGIEAVSNGVPLFAPPSEVHARRTLVIISGCLVALLLGLASARAGVTRVAPVATAPARLNAVLMRA